MYSENLEYDPCVGVLILSKNSRESKTWFSIDCPLSILTLNPHILFFNNGIVTGEEAVQVTL